MSFSYDTDLSKGLNYVRFKLNDTSEDDVLFQDEEIQYFIDQLKPPIVEKSLLKVCSTLLRQEIRSLALSNKKEVAGRDSVERADIESLKYALQMIEEEIKGGSVVLTGPVYGGVTLREDESNRCNTSLEEIKFYQGRIPNEHRRGRLRGIFNGDKC